MKRQSNKNLNHVADQKIAMYVMGAFAVGLLFVICIQNWLHFEQQVTSDVAGDYLYMQKVFETGNPFTPQYANSSELFFSRPWLIFVVFYAISRDLIFSSKMTLFVTTLLFVAVCGFFFKKLGFNWVEVVIGIDVLLGIQSYSVSCVIFRSYNAYVLFVIGFLLTLACLANHRDAQNHKIILLLAIVSFFFGLSGLRMLLVLYIPLVVVETMALFSASCGNSSTVPSRFWQALILLLCNLFGLGLNLIVLHPYMLAGNVSLNFEQYGSVWGAFLQEFAYFLQALGVSLDGQKIFSPAGISKLYMLFFLGCIFLGFAQVIRKKSIQEESKFVLYVLNVSIVLLGAYFILTSYTGFPRYWFMVPVYLALAVVLLYRFVSKMKSKIWKTLLCIVVLLAVITQSGEYIANAMRTSAPTNQMLLAEHLKASECNRILASYWNSSVHAFLSDGKVTALTFSDLDSVPMYDWITDRSDYGNDDEPITLVLTQEENETWKHSGIRGDVLPLADRTEEYAGYVLYHYDESPFGFDLMRYGYDAKFNFLQLRSNGTVDPEGRILLQGGESQYGPYCSVERGQYVVIIRGENLTAGFFDVFSISQNTAYPLNIGRLTDTEVEISFEAPQDIPDLEVRTLNNSGESVAIKDITIVPQSIPKKW